MTRQDFYLRAMLAALPGVLSSSVGAEFAQRHKSVPDSDLVTHMADRIADACDLIAFAMTDRAGSVCGFEDD